MADEFKHKDVGNSLTKAEYHAIGGHELDSGVDGDFIYWNAATSGFKRIAHANDYILHSEVVVKTADETVNNSDVLQDDDELFFAVGANEVWQFELLFLHISGAVPDIKYAFTVPVGGNIYAAPSHTTIGPAAPKDLTVAIVLTGAGADRVIWFIGWYTGGANSGNVQLQWAQNAANASDTKVLQNSCLMARRIV